jgi:XTP/dITP diphosphohydrolase
MSGPAVAAATANRGKLRELTALLSGLGLEVRGLDALPPIEFPAEADDYEANAVAKARAAARASGLPAVGDDSGLEVRALGGAPGPRSARYGGPDLDDAGRVAHLLEALAEVEPTRRGARFVCVAALVTPAGAVQVARGEWAGRILAAARGVGGFGYDPVFWIDELGAAAAELPPTLKNRVSHRARALAGLREALAGVAAARG